MSDLTCMGISKVNDMDPAEILRIMANQPDLGFLDDIRKTGRLPMKRATLEQIKAYHAHGLQSCPAQSQKPNDPPLQGENEDRQTHTQANDNDTLSYVFEGVAKNIQVERKDGSGDFEDAIRPDGTHWNQSPLPEFKSPGITNSPRDRQPTKDAPVTRRPGSSTGSSDTDEAQRGRHVSRRTHVKRRSESSNKLSTLRNAASNAKRQRRSEEHLSSTNIRTRYRTDIIRERSRSVDSLAEGLLSSQHGRSHSNSPHSENKVAPQKLHGFHAVITPKKTFMHTPVTKYAVPTVDIEIHLHHLTLANATIRRRDQSGPSYFSPI